MSAEQDATPRQGVAAPSSEAAASTATQHDASPGDALQTASPAPIHHDPDALATGDSEAAVAVPPEAASPSTAAPAEPAGDRPSQRIQIGSQRDPGGAPSPPPQPKPVTPGPPRADRPPTEFKKKSYPPPNVRSQLSPDLQQEMDAALAGASI